MKKLIFSIINNYSRVLSIILAVTFLFIIGVKFYRGSLYINDLKNRGLLSNSHIYELDKTTKSFVLKYCFTYQEVEYLGEYRFSNWQKRGNRLSYKYYPVIFDPENPNNSSLLFFNEDFEFFGFTPPDSITNR